MCRIYLHHVLEAATYHLRESHFLIVGDPFGVPVELVRELHLSPTHTSNLYLH